MPITLTNKIFDLLINVDRKEALKSLATILKEFDLLTAANLTESDCEPHLTKIMLEDHFYNEGNEEAGVIKLSNILDAVEKTINCDDYFSEDVEFECFVRPETSIEREENAHLEGIEWWIKDENMDIDKLHIQFQR